MKKSLLAVTTVLLLGCQSRSLPIRSYSSHAIPDPVSVVSVSESTLSDYDKIKKTLQRKGMTQLKLYRYRIKDKVNRHFDIYDFSERPEFKRGDCATRWQAPRNTSYPRLSAANPNCTPLSIEPKSPSIVIPQTPSARLKRIAFLNHWLDKDEKILLRSWGKPDKITPQKNGVEFRYHYKYTMSGRSGDQTYTAIWHCQTDWRLRNGVVFDYQEKGNACY